MAQLERARSERVAPAMLAEDDTLDMKADILGLDDFIGLAVLENAVLVPKLMGETVGLNAVTVISALVIGSELLGFAGALLAVPTAAIIQVLFEELYLKEKEPA